MTRFIEGSFSDCKRRADKENKFLGTVFTDKRDYYYLLDEQISCREFFDVLHELSFDGIEDIILSVSIEDDILYFDEWAGR